MADSYADLADLIEKGEAKALDQIKQEESGKNKRLSRESPSNDRRSSRDVRHGSDEVVASPRSNHHHHHNRSRDAEPRYLDERAENDERRLRRSKDVSDDDARAHSDWDSTNGSARDRHRRRSQSPRRERGSYRERDYGSRVELRDSYRPGGHHNGDRFRDDDSYRPGTDDRRRRHRDDSRERDRDRDRDHDRHRERERDDRRGGGRDRQESRRNNSSTPPVEGANDRDERTVFVQQIAASCSSNKLLKFFEQIGPVVDAQIVKDRVSGRSKGVGYVEFRQKESIEKALGLTGQKINGVPIIVQQTEAEKNRQPRNTSGGQNANSGAPFHRLYVGNIHFSVTEDDLRSIFGPFGDLEFVQIQKDETSGRSRGYGFVQYTDPTCAKKALDNLNGFELAKRPIRVGLGNDKFTDSTTKTAPNPASQQFQGSEFSGAGGRGAYAGGSGNFDRAARDADKTGHGSALDDSDVGGVNISNFNRHDLMRKLARVETSDAPVIPQVVAKQKPVDLPQTATRCIVLRHMFTPEDVSTKSDRDELESDVFEECNKKYGTVVHIGLNLDSTDGEIYLKFKDLQGSKNAYQGLNGRYFATRQINASYMVDAIYNTNFPKAASL